MHSDCAWLQLRKEIARAQLPGVHFDPNASAGGVGRVGGVGSVGLILGDPCLTRISFETEGEDLERIRMIDAIMTLAIWNGHSGDSGF